MMTRNSELWLKLTCAIAVATMVGCSSMKTPATADVAVSKAAVDSAASADGAQYAPLDMRSAREKLAKANKAMAAKADSAKAKMAADALQDDIRVLREELKRSRK